MKCHLYIKKIDINNILLIKEIDIINKIKILI